jgi:capsular polysaccharide transport system permease protein
MTTKLTASRFRLRRRDAAEGTAPPPAAEGADLPFAPPVEDGFGSLGIPGEDASRAPVTPPPTEADLDAIRAEGLTARQLRMARRLAQKHDLPATSDLDAVRLLRDAGIDPFQRTSLLELLPGAPEDASRSLPDLPREINVPSTQVRAEQNHARELMEIQRDLVRRRRRRSLLLAMRLFLFVGLPTLVAGIYYFRFATPFYATHAEFVIQHASAAPAGGSGLGGLLQGTTLATSQDSIAVQGYLQSREAMNRLDADHGFRAHFEDAAIDRIQRLDPDASQETAYKTYRRNIQISYDPSEGLVKMEVIAADPQKATDFASALVGYAEEQVDHLTQRMRGDQMAGAQERYEEAENELQQAQRRVVELQEKFKVLSSDVEVTLITGQITNLESQLLTEKLSLEQMISNEQPNRARMEPIRQRIGVLEAEIASARARLTEQTGDGESIAVVQSELLTARTDVETRQMLLAQALQAREASRAEANRQTRYLSLSVSPIPPDEAAYPRAFEYTVVAFLIFSGIYLMISMTVAILREQVSA